MLRPVINLDDERLLRSYNRIGKAIIEYISDMDLAWEIEIAQRIYFGKYLNSISQRNLYYSYKPFIQWLIFSYKLYSSGRSLIESVYDSYNFNVHNIEKDTIYSLKNTYESFYKVYSVHKDKVIARDIFSNETVFLPESIMKHNVRRYCGIFTRIASMGNRSIPVPGYSILSNSLLKEIQCFIMNKYMDYKRINNNMSIREFINTNSLMIHRYFLHYHI